LLQSMRCKRIVCIVEKRFVFNQIVMFQSLELCMKGVGGNDDDTTN
jgi:hypothetical protein